MGLLQQELRRVVKSLKQGAKQNEGAVLANIQNRAAAITEQRKPVVVTQGKREDFAGRREDFAGRREDFAGRREDFAGKARASPMNDFGIGKGLNLIYNTGFEGSSPKFTPFPHTVLTAPPSNKAFPPSQKPEPLRFHSAAPLDFPSSCEEKQTPPQDPAESLFMGEDPLDLASEAQAEGVIEQTQKSPLLAQNRAGLAQNRAGLAAENEQNTIVNFSIFGGEKAAVLLQEKSEANFMSFKEFSEKREDETLKKSDLLDKVKKLSFREEDYFEQSVRIEEQRNNEENCSFELLNGHRDEEGRP